MFKFQLFLNIFMSNKRRKKENMKMAKETLLSILLILGMLSIASLGTFAYFNDVGTVGQNVVMGGVLDLKVDGEEVGVPITLSNMKPGDSVEYQWELEESWESTIQGYASVCFSEIINYENGQNAPEALVDETGGELEGELGEKLKVKIGVMGCGTNYHWYWIEPENFNALSGQSYAEDGLFNGASTVLKPRTWGITFKMVLWLPEEVGNEIQSDSVDFEITFRLDQVV